jgi:hypothetical protein
MVAKKIWRDIKKSADKLCAPGQKPFLILDKAPGHVAKKSQAELDEWWDNRQGQLDVPSWEDAGRK